MTYEELDILVVARHPWGGRPPLGDWQMSRALAASHRVLYVEPPEVLRSRLAPLSRVVRPEIRYVEHNTHVVRPIALPGATRPRTAWASDAIIQAQVALASRRHFAEPPVLITFDPLRGRLGHVPRKLTVYWRRDRLADLAHSRNAHWLGLRDRELLRHADVVTCTATTLLDEAKQHATGEVVHIPNGCDVQHFAADLPRPEAFPRGDVVLGFVGGAFWRLDMDLIRHLADEEPTWTLLFIGDETAALPDRPNVVQVPYLPYEEVPAWMAQLDVGLILYDMTLPFNEGSFPIKALEYLAAGVPVVSTDMPALEGMGPWVRRASTPEGFVIEVREALRAGPTASSCRAVAHKNTWADRGVALVDVARAALSRPSTN